MKALITYTDGSKPAEVKEIKTLSGLLNMQKKYERPIIIRDVDPEYADGHYGKIDFTIEVYNDYRE